MSISTTVFTASSSSGYLSSWSEPGAWFGVSEAIWSVKESLTDQRSSYSSSPPNMDYNSTGWNDTNVVDIGLSDHGCIIDAASGERNCTHACYVDTSLMWIGENASYTLYNCMMYPLLAKAYGLGILTYSLPKRWPNGSIEHVSDDNSTAVYYNAASELLGTYGIVEDAMLDLNSSAPWDGINKCTKAYCEARSGSSCDVTFQMGQGPSWRIGKFIPRVTTNSSLCNNVNGGINPDLGGIGMMIAFVLQISILLGGWFIGSVNSVGLAVATCFILFFRRARQGQGTRWQQAKRLQRRVRRSRQSVALKVALVEFLKTQTFFILAVSVAAMLAVGNAAYLEVSSWQDLWNNIGFISTVALSGCYPIVLNLLVLRKTKALSWYLLGISAACMAMATTLWIYNTFHQPSPNQALNLMEGYVLPACGTGQSELFNPTWTCMPDGQFEVEGLNGEATALIFPLVVLVFLLAEEMKVFKDLQAQDKDNEKRVNGFVHARQLLVDRYEPTLLWMHKRGLEAWYRTPVNVRRVFNTTGRKTRKHWKDVAFIIERWTELLMHKCPPALRRAGTTLNTTIIVPAWAYTCTTSTQAWKAYRDFGHLNILLWILNACYKVIPFLTEMGIVAINVVLLLQYVAYLVKMGGGSWSLGQVISVTIWVPVLVEYVYLLVCGIEEGFEYRLSEPFHVKRDDDDDEVDEGYEKADDGEELVDTKRNGPELDDMGQDHMQDNDTEMVQQQIFLVPKRSYTGT